MYNVVLVQVYSKVIQLRTYTYSFFFRVFLIFVLTSQTARNSLAHMNISHL